jgi:hypothetical protein
VSSAPRHAPVPGQVAGAHERPDRGIAGDRLDLHRVPHARHRNRRRCRIPDRLGSNRDRGPSGGASRLRLLSASLLRRRSAHDLTGVEHVGVDHPAGVRRGVVRAWTASTFVHTWPLPVRPL